MMRFCKSLLERLLGVAVRSEKSSRERKLEKQLRQEQHKRLREKAEWAEQDRLTRAELEAIHTQKLDLEAQVASREHTIKEKEHEIGLLKLSVDGLNCLVARQQRWIENERIAESRPLDVTDEIDPAILEMAKRLSENQWGHT